MYQVRNSLLFVLPFCEWEVLVTNSYVCTLQISKPHVMWCARFLSWSSQSLSVSIVLSRSKCSWRFDYCNREWINLVTEMPINLMLKSTYNFESLTGQELLKLECTCRRSWFSTFIQFQFQHSSSRGRCQHYIRVIPHLAFNWCGYISNLGSVWSSDLNTTQMRNNIDTAKYNY